MFILSNLLLFWIFLLIFLIGGKLFCFLMAFLMDSTSEEGMKDTEEFLNKYSPYRRKKR